MRGYFDVDTGSSGKVQIRRPPPPKRSYRRGMGSDQGDFPGIRHLDAGSAGNGQRLFLFEATFGTLSNRYRCLTRNWEESPKNSEDAVELANCHRLIRNYGRDLLGQI